MKTQNSKRNWLNLKTLWSILKNVWNKRQAKKLNLKILEAFLKHVECPPDEYIYDNAKETYRLRWENSSTEENFMVYIGTGIIKSSPFKTTSMVIWAGGYNRSLNSRIRPYPFQTRQDLFEFYKEANFVINSFKGVY